MRRDLSFEYLLSDDKFIDWIKSNPSDVEWEAFKINQVLNNADLELARNFVEHSILSQEAPNDILRKDLWEQIAKKTSSNENVSAKNKWIALIFILLVGLLFLGIYTLLTPVKKQQDIAKSDDFWIEYTNTGNTNWPINLSDGSQVILEPKSKIKYPRLFDQKSRKVQLTGDAFFDISQDTLKPFYVYANEAVIRVLGTSFYVKAEEEDKDIKVIVESGKVAVYKGREIREFQAKKIENIKPLLVMPNQIATLEKSSLKLAKRLVSRPTLTQPLERIKKIHFENSTITEISKALEDAYGIEIILDKNISSNCKLTTTLTDQPLFEKLKIICDPLGLHYFEKDVRIHIVGNCMN